MMIQAIIVDDERAAREELTKLIDTYCEDIKIVATGKNVSEARELIYKYSPDIVFLDIDMPMGNGFSLFDNIKNPGFDTIFTTAHQEYAIKAFRVSALDYLTKPIDYRELQEAIIKYKNKRKIELRERRIQLLLENMMNRPTEFNKLVLPDYEGYSLINTADIVYCQADGSYTHLHLLDGKKITTSKLLKQIEELLPDETFYRIHKSYIVNLNLIHRCSKIDGFSVILENGVVLDVSERTKKEFLDKLMRRNQS